MKELSLEEKAKRYDEAIKIAKEINNEQCAQPFNVMTRVFPELKESEDEEIRKEITTYLKSVIANKGYGDSIMESWIAWLEKQGEKKFEQKFFINDKVVHKATGKIWTIHHYLKDTNSYYVEDNDGLLHHYRESELNLVEQKPAWSKEDEYLLDETIKHLEALIRITKKQGSAYSDEIQYYQRDIDWLKSLKDRIHSQKQWKPSDEQIDALEDAIADAVSSIQKNILNSLYSDLKKLREE